MYRIDVGLKLSFFALLGVFSFGLVAAQAQQSVCSVAYSQPFSYALVPNSSCHANGVMMYSASVDGSYMKFTSYCLNSLGPITNIKIALRNYNSTTATTYNTLTRNTEDYSGNVSRVYGEAMNILMTIWYARPDQIPNYRRFYSTLTIIYSGLVGYYSFAPSSPCD